MDRLHAMRVFTRIVELGSFTRAADDLSLPRATLTHTIKRLEAQLGTQLLQRTTRRVTVTHDGQTYYGHCRRLLADLDEVEGQFRDAAAQVKGQVRVDLPATFARLIVIPALPEFFARYPGIELHLSTGDRFVNLVQEGIDCVLRAGALPDSGLIGRRVTSLSQATVASAAYLREHGLPETLAELQKGHVAVNWASPTTRRSEPLDFMVQRKLRQLALPSRVTVNGVEAYLACCEAGMGIAQFPRYRIADALAKGELCEILPAYPPPSLPVTVLYPPQRQLPPRLRVFIDWLIERMADVR
ncbi:LysR family transcriptional regulator [Dyella silvatica]|uniref:LysR family transcriptional regulator n=1 Tax=Dyella silvatica TaxID=2992128 RepID=UPI0022573FB9|nr:LysR family transcriptional regulator [Dyella silvatica]